MRLINATGTYSMDPISMGFNRSTPMGHFNWRGVGGRDGEGGGESREGG